jgi:ammonia channel protein AmtB
VRRKNSETVLIKTMVIFCIAVLATYTLGYGFAYGSTYVIGLTDYFTPFVLDEELEGREVKWILLFATTSMTA